MFVINKQSHSPLYAQLYQQIRTDILGGDLAPGTKLPSVRTLSVELDISRNTIEMAYERLHSDGYLISKAKSGYYVNAINVAPAFLPAQNHILELSPVEKYLTGHRGEEFDHNDLQYDFYFGTRLVEDMPFAEWQKHINKCLRDYKDQLASYRWNTGELGLRQEILKRLKRTGM